MTDDPILDAIEHAEATGEGAGYTLRITFTSGKVLEGVAVTIERDEFEAMERYRLIGDGADADLFVNLRNVETVTIQW